MNKKPIALIADDDFTIRLLACEALEQADFEVKEAEDGKQALEIFKQVQPEIVLLDVKMPFLSGFEVCKAIRQYPNGKNLPILMVTGADDIESIRSAYDAGATDFMTKPINWLILVQRVRYMLRASRNVEKLRKSEAILATAQKIARMGSWEMDIKSNEFRCSEEICRIYGLNHCNIKKYEDLFESMKDDDRKEIIKKYQQLIHQAVPFQIDHQIFLPDGNERIVNQQASASVDENGHIQQLIGTIQDITERKLAESLETDKNRVLEMIIRNKNLSDIMKELVTIIETQEPEAFCSIYLIKENRFYLQAGSLMAEPFFQAMDAQPVHPETGGSPSIAAYTGDMVIISDIKNSNLWKKKRDAALNHGIRACCSLPVISGQGQILGVISAFYRKICHPDNSVVKLLEVLAKLASVAIERRILSEKLEHQARHDVLTGLPNRAAISEYLNQALIQASKTSEKVAVFFIDLDRFKHINDSLGHPVGDGLLKEVTERLKTCIHENSIMGRMGGDEFMHVLKGIKNQENITKAALKILELVAPPFKVKDQNLYLGASIGISIYPDDGTDAMSLQKNSDTAMFYAKNKGGNRFQFFSQEMNMAAIERLEIENELRKAVEQGDFELHYQPKYNLKDNSLAGFEALLRWNHHSRGRVPPVKFIPVAEESELIIPIGTWVLREACRQNSEWEKAGFGAFKIAVNVSVVQFLQKDFIEIVETALKQYNLPPQRLELEVTESVVISDLSIVSESLSKLQSMGIITTIDDFGTGYSSMSYLNQLPINCLKIDRSFIVKLSGEKDIVDRGKMMVHTIVKLAHDLNFTVVAEGIEEHEHLEFLKEIECDIGQGYYFSVPLSAKEVEKM
ncbi:Two component system response regulator, PAS and GAF and GGDEF and EAL domain-containing [Desulfonema limicola]|uniref:Two component system response regulator, PAS and GAF and GGDEF and EAL domain-containing n=1 Tax=Desulfonema limicola TaxID=45656 RepID=A0A975BBI8_9BACT|nr:EAL domain-containing protein [Desulfonema limicola]QTA82322.1 Two component system response regulator, PAS and GAF and GGDEF and EAL domain-containing [Desulfonema limicola]